MEKAENGFRVTGIWRLNPNVFGEEDYAAAENPLPKTDLTAPAAVGDQLLNLSTTPTPSLSTAVTPTSGPSTIAPSVEDISPLPAPKLSETKKRKREAQHSSRLTSTPVKKLLAEKEAGKRQKGQRKPKAITESQDHDIDHLKSQ